MTYVLGVDGGGTGSRAVILDGDGVERGRGEGPPALAGRVRRRDALGEPGKKAGPAPTAPGDPEDVADSVEEAVRAAAGDAGIPLPADHLCAGLAGAGPAEVREAVGRALGARGISRSVTVVTDADAALQDAFPGEGPGILLVCGTGSIALGRATGGRIVRAGGWGALLDDAGSGYRIGLAALTTVLRAHDGRASPTRLTGLALEALEIPEPPDLVAAAQGAPKHRIAALAPGVVGLAREEDGAATEIVREAVEELTSLVTAVSARIGSSEGDGGAAGAPPGDGSTGEGPTVALHGGLVAPGRPLRPLLRRTLESRGLRVLERRVDPARGAGRLALEAVLRRRD